jgi:hypothetical protein
MKGWRDAAHARDRVVIAAKQFHDAKTKHAGTKKKVAV